jgi:hypothetical protein
LSHILVREWLDFKGWRFEGVCVKICWRFTNELWGLERWVLCSLWPRLSWILRLVLMYNLLPFTDICLQLSLIIIPDKQVTKLDHVMTRPLIWTIACCSAKDLYWLGAGRYIGYTELLISLPLLQINFCLVPRLDEGSLIEKFLQLLTVSQPTGALYLEIIVEKKGRKEDRTIESKENKCVI